MAQGRDGKERRTFKERVPCRFCGAKRLSGSEPCPTCGQIDEAFCVCGRRKEDYPARNPEVCYSCFLDYYMTRSQAARYMRREAYEWDPLDKLSKATRRPPTGITILDAPSAPRISDTIPYCLRKPRLL